MPYISDVSKQTVVRGWEYCIPKYAEAGAAVEVGDLVGFDANGNLVPAAAAVSGTGTVRIAVPRRERGMGEIANNLPRSDGRTNPTTFQSGEEMAYITPHAGVEILMNLRAGQTVGVGSVMHGTDTAGQVAEAGSTEGTTALDTGVLVGEVVVPDGEDPATYSVTTGAGETAKIIVEVRQ